MSTSVTPSQPIERVYAEHRLSVLRLATLLTGSREHAEDVVQSVFASAHPRWDTIGQQLPYLRRAVVNVSADVHRRRARDRAAPEPETPHGPRYSAFDLPEQVTDGYLELKDATGETVVVEQTVFGPDRISRTQLRHDLTGPGTTAPDPA